MTKTSKQWLCTKQLAVYTGFSSSFFEKRRIYGDGPPFHRIGGSIRYNAQDIDDWLASRRVTEPAFDDQ